MTVLNLECHINNPDCRNRGGNVCKCNIDISKYILLIDDNSDVTTQSYSVGNTDSAATDTPTPTSEVDFQTTTGSFTESTAGTTTIEFK